MIKNLSKMFLSYNNNEEYFEFPILPPEFSIDIASNNASEQTINRGEITIIKPNNQQTFSVKSVFPAYRDFMVISEELKAPYEYVKLIQKWRNTLKPLRFVFIRSGLVKTNSYKINTAVSVERFNWKDPNHQGDIEFELSLKEFRFYKFNQYVIDENIEKLRPIEQNIPAEYLVSEGETLEGICIKFFGTDDWKLLVELKRLNGLTDYDVIKKTYVGKKIKLFTSEISI